MFCSNPIHPKQLTQAWGTSTTIISKMDAELQKEAYSNRSAFTYSSLFRIEQQTYFQNC